MKKFFSLVLALVMALSLTTVAWAAPGDVAEINGTGYATLQAAVDAARDGETITLLSDIEYNSSNCGFTDHTGPWYDGVKYTGDKSFTIDLNGKTISDNGTLNDYLLNFINKGTKANEITLKNGTISGGANLWNVISVGASSETYPTTFNLGDALTINADGSGNSGEDGVVKVRGNSVMNVLSGATVVSTNALYGVQAAAGTATLNIYDGATVTMNMSSGAAVTGVGIVNIYGGTITSAGWGVFTSSSGTPEFTIYGGSITGTAGAVASCADVSSYPTADPSVTISGGDINGKVSKEIYGTPAGTAGGEVIVSGGKFTDDSAKTYQTNNSTITVAGNTIAKNNNGSVVVNPVAQVGNTKYETVAAAIAAANGAPVILVDTNATIPAGYTVATDVNGNLVVIAGTNVPASAAKGAYFSTDLTNLAVYPGCDLANFNYTLENYTVAADAAKTFAKVAIWQTNKVTGAKTVVETAVVAASADSANLAFVNGSSITYLNTNVANWTTTATAVATVDFDDVDACGQKFVKDDVDVYTDAAGKLYVEAANGTVMANVGGKLVKLANATADATTYTLDALDGVTNAALSANVVYTVKHDYAADSQKVGIKNSITKVYCKECKDSFAFVDGDPADAIAKFGAGNYVNIGAGYEGNIYVALTGSSAGSVVTPSTDVKVESAATFDAGIAMYVGMSVMAAAGSAVVIGKKKD